jgi:hypothetical protein
MTRPATVTYEVDDGVPAAIRIVPADPGPETNADGVPAAMLYLSDRTGLLTLGVRWWPAEPELAAIRDRVAASLKRTPADFAVSPDGFIVSSVALVLTPVRGERIELARVGSSGTPPYTALFSVDVSEHLELVRRACVGEPGLLQIEVQATLTRGRSATTVLAAELGPWTQDLPGADTDALVGRIEALVAAGLIERTRSAAPGPGPDGPDAEEADLAAEADRNASQRLLAAIASAAPPAGPSAIGMTAPPPGPPIGTDGTTVVTAAATAHRPHHQPLVRTADVGQWLRGSPSAHVLVAGGAADPGPPDGPAAQVPVALGFAAQDAPLARVEVATAGGSAVLAAPFSDPVSVPDGDSLAVTTRYAAGPAYSATLPRGRGSWHLSPADLGLTQVTVDATHLHEAGATAVDADVFYQPEDRGSPDRRTVRFGPDTWQASWFVVSRGPELAGQLLLSLLVTPGGVPGVQSSVRSTIATVQL